MAELGGTHWGARSLVDALCDRPLGRVSTGWWLQALVTLTIVSLQSVKSIEDSVFVTNDTFEGGGGDLVDRLPVAP